MKKIKIKLTDIVAPTQEEQFRVSGTDQEQVNVLAAHMSKHGQLTPIEVKQDGPDQYKISVGNHRFAAAQQLGWTHLNAYVVSHNSLKEEGWRQFEENEEHIPGKGNNKSELIKLIRDNLYLYKHFGPNPTLNDLNRVVDWAKSMTSSFAPQTIRAVAKKLLEEAPAPNYSRGTLAYIKATKQLINAIKVATDGDWDGTSVKTCSQGMIVQCISQDSDATIKPGTSLVQKYNTGAKSCAVFYIGTVEGLSDAKIDDQRKRWVKRVRNFSKHIQSASNNKLTPFDREVILPQKDSEIRSGVKRLELHGNNLVPVF